MTGLGLIRNQGSNWLTTALTRSVGMKETTPLLPRSLLGGEGKSLKGTTSGVLPLQPSTQAMRTLLSSSRPQGASLRPSHTLICGWSALVPTSRSRPTLRFQQERKEDFLLSLGQVLLSRSIMATGSLSWDQARLSLTLEQF